jgi:hypothetical protein
MFNFLFRNKTEIRYLEMQKNLIVLLKIQSAFIPNFSFSKNGKINKSALGYVYGFIDCAAQIADMEINNEPGRNLLFGVVTGISDRSEEIALKAIQGKELWEDQTFLRGVALGGKEYNAWASSSGKITPFGLGRSF